MRIWHIILSFWLLQFPAFLCHNSSPPASTAQIHDGDFKESLARVRYSVIYFYSDSCGYCHRFEPIYENLKLLFNGSGGGGGGGRGEEEEEGTGGNANLQFVSTNAKENKKLSKLLSIKHYPTIKLLDSSSNRIWTFEDKREIEQLSKFITRHTQIEPNYSNIASRIQPFANVSSILTSSRDSLIIFTMSYFHDWKDSHYPSHFIQRVASQFAPIDFYVLNVDEMTDFSVPSQFGAGKFPSAVYVRGNSFRRLNTDSRDRNFGDLNEIRIRKFIEAVDSAGSSWVSFDENSRGITTGKKDGENTNDDDDFELEHIEL
ncbi:uncharacterized protein LODBEIA_P51180 [Lodderomyces beijingensis]|uniref:Thioredoxin domain-containing protein n=1 Tax=Lodderomyces beijingensis TaxID=1775926 RepID=A0ABP0ZSJ8_9ASCO